ncbi:ATPase, T2SS/T4P/T4SS family [Acidithiobacillus ferrooxidans]|uniref:ATPase, T2SS/T4P/T4SS family n=1 Tax=Acidithiobacillus ferrooxidans TaxID=920 RepID=UPI00214AEEBF|nr:ATPase, T2SS/T4P/T4SS family [Acidithiobacillus ferrooxidans]MCR2830990.1 ATPase, T2SS/T4P/T4SS family [Acidithiobacillus ferrooxidans]
MALDPKVEAHQRLVEQLRRSFGQLIMAAFDDEKVVEIMANPDGKLLVERHGQGIVQEGTIAPQQVQNIIGLVAAWQGTISNAEKPICEGALPPEFGGARFEGCLPPITPGPLFAIRLRARSIYTLDDYFASGIITGGQHAATYKAIDDRKNILVSGGTGCHAKGHPILLANGGITKIEDIVVGDRVMGADGKPRLVTHLHRGVDSMYRITPNKGVAFEVNGGHILALKNHSSDDFECISVNDYIKKSADFRHRHKLSFMRGTCAFAESTDLPVDPYLLGVIIGDGYVGSNCVQVGKPDVEVYEAVSSASATMGMQVNLYSRTDSNGMLKYGIVKKIGGGGRTNNLLRILRDLGLDRKKAGEKFIPHSYRVADVNSRLDLLAGLIDTDGSVDTSHGRYKFTSKSLQLVDDVAFVARSLGFYVKVTSYTGLNTYTGKTATYHTAILSGGMVLPNRVQRKTLQHKDESRVDVLVTGFSVEPTGEGEYFGFECDMDHLYVDANFMVHHNSGKTTMVNAVLHRISKIADLDQRVVTIEDTSELQVTAPNAVSLFTDDASNIDMTRLLKATMRLRPDRIIVGEVRDGSALALLKAWGTGHPGGAATVHANNPQAALLRLDQLCQEAGVPSQSELIAEAVDIVIQIQRDKSHPAGRRITSMWDVKKQGEIA